MQKNSLKKITVLKNYSNYSIKLIFFWFLTPMAEIKKMLGVKVVPLDVLEHHPNFLTYFMNHPEYPL